MKTFIHSVGSVSSKALQHWLTFAFVCFFTINALGTAIVGALVGMPHWETASAQTKLLVLVAVFVNWSNAMMAMAYRGRQNVAQGLPLIQGATRVETTAVTTEKTSVS